MDIKEIALKVADSLRNKVDGISHMQSNQGLIKFAEALVAELAKQNKPIYAFRRKGLDDFCTCDKRRFDELSQKPALFEVQVFYRSPPTAEQIANETAEACAAYLTSGRYMVLNPGVLISAEQHTQYIKNHDIYKANAVRSGAWKGFKK